MSLDEIPDDDIEGNSSNHTRGQTLRDSTMDETNALHIDESNQNAYGGSFIDDDGAQTTKETSAENTESSATKVCD